jgi:NAD(P)H-flavin reductase
MIAGGTGIAPICALLDQIQRDSAPAPTVSLFYGGLEPDDLYALPRLREFEVDNAWLTIVSVVERDRDERSACKIGDLVDVVIREDAWQRRYVLVSGSPGMIRGTVAKLMVTGVPLDLIQYDPFTVD